jgi:hypothetical protein
MRSAVAALLLIGVCCAATRADADGIAARRGHWAGRVCRFEGLLYREGQFCSLNCEFALCTMQVCHGGRWVIEPAACRAGFGCPRAC